MAVVAGPVLAAVRTAAEMRSATNGKRFCVAAGITAGYTMYSLRHFFGSNCLAMGIPITDVAEWMGHKSIEVAYRIYRHLMPSSVGRAARLLDMGIGSTRCTAVQELGGEECRACDNVARGAVEVLRHPANQNGLRLPGGRSRHRARPDPDVGG
ncbi:tyrosine-type recombinase/integrase [Streptomyces sp. NPDC059832]|uniref:tyrosine-type recombinase/integrase n=1 Tax=Streptomyces sp. NPDC059832 TaxID=3346966 RepID=UPI0036503EA0